MNSSEYNYFAHPKILIILFIILIPFILEAQRTNNKDHLYRPTQAEKNTQQNFDSSNSSYYQDTTKKVVNQDSIKAREKFVKDSIAIREAFIQDSIAKREAFILDSIAKRMAFVRDSIAKRKRRIDSLNFLKNSIPKYLEASLKTLSEEIIIHTTPVQIINDSILSDYSCSRLILSLSKPYTPWKTTFKLSDKPIKFGVDTINKLITWIGTNSFTHKYKYNQRNRILIIEETGIVLSKRYGKLYNVPIDSVYLDAQGRILKIKRYHQYHQVVNNYRKGSFMYSHLKQVKQYSYSGGSRITKLEVINFCDRWRKLDPHKVCNIITYNLTGQGNNYMLTRKNDPENLYSDGQFTFNFAPDGSLKSASFKNRKNTEDWKSIVELNEEGNVSRYVHIDKGKVNRTLLVNYNDNPKAKYKVETISCYFEDDKVCYKQVNNTTGKERNRDRLTLEWSDWK